MTDHWFFSQALRIKNYILYSHSLLLEPPVSTAPPVIYQSSPNCSHTVICLLGSVSSALPLHRSNILHLHHHLPPPMVCHSFSGILQSIVYIVCATGRVLPHPTRITRPAGQVFDTSTPAIAGFMILDTTRPNPPKNGKVSFSYILRGCESMVFILVLNRVTLGAFILTPPPALVRSLLSARQPNHSCSQTTEFSTFTPEMHAPYPKCPPVDITLRWGVGEVVGRPSLAVRRTLHLQFYIISTTSITLVWLAQHPPVEGLVQNLPFFVWAKFRL
ncbi:hypothetical protein L211DRAFT_235554 [Terfezia boudieri ATCC MYA-4762]|uniref:Uncharacterized protein n=1 Tax=Terfezia boudieri ATCC MYA-4762 TaxID=1051890 RepID=A0A3N4M039_9PEZI|nr:hypothetical protein L211DRAFT_235554 [Terfezia boudieri ATCC MYA-4762]